MSGRDMGFVALRRMHGGGDRMIAREGGREGEFLISKIFERLLKTRSDSL